MSVQVRDRHSNPIDDQALARELQTSRPALSASFTYDDIEAEALERLAHKGFDWEKTLEVLTNRRGATRPLVECA
jgi:hypothetical protein